MADSIKQRLLAKKKRGIFLKEQIHQCRLSTQQRFETLQAEVESTVNEQVNLDGQREKREAEKINHEFDSRNHRFLEENRKIREEIHQKREEIRAKNEVLKKNNEEIKKNNEEREKVLLKNKKESECRLALREQERRELEEEIENLIEAIKPRIKELEKSAHDALVAVMDALEKLDSLMMTPGNKVKDLVGLERSVTCALNMPMNISAMERIRCRLSGLKFVKGVGREKCIGRIDGYDGEWRLIDETNVTEIIKRPTIVGCIGSSNVIVTDYEIGKMHTYLMDMNTKHIEKVTEGNCQSCIISCALLNDGKIVCGKRREGCRSIAKGQPLTGCIAVYDREWKLVTELSIPRNGTQDDTWVYVAADPEGMIIAAEWGQGNIHVINPKNGSTLRTITEDAAVRGVVSSGLVLAKPSSDHCRVLKINKEGSYKEIPFSNSIRSACIDPLTDALYVVTSDQEFKTCRIEHVRTRFGSRKKKVATLCLSKGLDSITGRKTHLVLSQVIMTSSGKLIACDGNSIQCMRKDAYSII